MNAREAMEFAHNVARCVGGDDDEYYSAANEAVVVAMQKHDPATGPLQPFLYTCVRHAVISVQQKDGARLGKHKCAPRPNVSHPRAFPDIFHLIAKLPSSMLALANDHWRDRLTYREIAAKHGCSIAWLHTLLTRIRAQLQHILDDEAAYGWPETTPAFC